MSTPRWVYTLQSAQKYYFPLERKDDNKPGPPSLSCLASQVCFKGKTLNFKFLIFFFQKIVGLLNIIKQSDEFSNNSFIKEYWLKS